MVIMKVEVFDANKIKFDCYLIFNNMGMIYVLIDILIKKIGSS